MNDTRLLRVTVLALMLGILSLSPIFIEAAHCEPLIISQAAFAGVQIADLHSTHQAVNSGRGREGNPLMGTGSDAQAILIKSGITATAIFTAHHLNKQHPVLARVMLYSMTAVIAGVSYRNYRLSRGA